VRFASLLAGRRLADACSSLSQPAKKAFELQLKDIRAWRVLEKGGHFLALEAAQTLADDMDKHFQTDEIRSLLGLHNSGKGAKM
jgi:hypothetical protein